MGKILHIPAKYISLVLYKKLPLMTSGFFDNLAQVIMNRMYFLLAIFLRMV